MQQGSDISSILFALGNSIQGARQANGGSFFGKSTNAPGGSNDGRGGMPSGGGEPTITMESAGGSPSPAPAMGYAHGGGTGAPAGPQPLIQPSVSMEPPGQGAPMMGGTGMGGAQPSAPPLSVSFGGGSTSDNQALALAMAKMLGNQGGR